MLHSSPSSALRLAAVVIALLTSIVPALAQEEVPEAGEKPTPAAAKQPNVVVVVIDDMSWEELELIRLPNLIGIARAGRTYSQFYATPICSPSRYGLQFGGYGVRQGMLAAVSPYSRHQKGVPLSQVCIADVLQQAGYSTALFGKWHLSTVHEFPEASGPSSLHDAPRAFGYQDFLAGCPTNLGTEGTDSHYVWKRSDNGEVTHVTGYSADVVTDAFVEWWKTPDERARFAVVNYFTPHEPFTPPPTHLLPPDYRIGSGMRERFVASMIALDTVLAKVVEAIDLSNTYLFVLADNGTPREVKPLSPASRGYKHSVFQGGINVPLFVAGPGVVPGRTNQLAHVADIPRTLMELCGAESATGFVDSVSLAPSLKGERTSRAPVLINVQRNFRDAPEQWAVIDEDGWKLVDLGHSRLLFNIAKDPWEEEPVRDRARTLQLLKVRSDYMDAIAAEARGK